MGVIWLNSAILLTSAIDPSDVSAILEYLFQLTLVYIGCFIGASLRDLLTASRSRTKAKLGSSFLYSIPCAFIMATVYDLISRKLGFGTLVLACVFVGIWSREVTSILLNNKICLSLVKVMVSWLINKNGSLSEEDKKELTDVFETAVKEGKKAASEEEKKETGTSIKEDESNCATAKDNTSEDATPEELEKDIEKDEPTESTIDTSEEDIEIEDELSGDPVGEFDWTEIIEYWPLGY